MYITIDRRVPSPSPLRGDPRLRALDHVVDVDALGHRPAVLVPPRARRRLLSIINRRKKRDVQTSFVRRAHDSSRSRHGLPAHAEHLLHQTHAELRVRDHGETAVGAGDDEVRVIPRQRHRRDADAGQPVELPHVNQSEVREREHGDARGEGSRGRLRPARRRARAAAGFRADDAKFSIRGRRHRRQRRQRVL
eukprot:31006-Pelagococcus_subviridis.AAC.13